MMGHEPRQQNWLGSAHSFFPAAGLTVSLLLAWMLYGFGCSLPVAVALPISFLLLSWLRWSFLAPAFPGLLFYALVFGGVQPARLESTWLLIFLCTCQLALVARLVFFVTADPWHRVITERMHFSAPPRRRVLLSTSLRWSHGGSLLFIGLAVASASWLASPLRGPLLRGPHIGLIPEAYFAVRLVLLLAFLALLGHGAASYWGWIHHPGPLAAVQLRRELWQWQRGEDRRVARTRKKWIRKQNMQRPPTDASHPISSPRGTGPWM